MRHLIADLFPSLTTVRDAYNASRDVLSAVPAQAPIFEEDEP
jgi:hypothetical protein